MYAALVIRSGPMSNLQKHNTKLQMIIYFMFQTEILYAAHYYAR